MLTSMTGFGRATAAFPQKEITVEIKSVNHRYFDFSAKVPRSCGFLEEKLKSFVSSHISRGKIEVFVGILHTSSDNQVIKVNESAAASYISGLREISEKFSIEDDLKVSTIAGFNDLFIVKAEEQDADQIWEEVKSVAQEAVSLFVKMRNEEGARLYTDISERAKQIAQKTEEIDALSAKSVDTYKERIYEKIKEVLADHSVDEGRILTEVAIFADKVAVDEETVRLRSHLSQLDKMTSSNEPVGRKLDFLVQEINREINTIGSKSNDIEISKIVVEVKSEIEKIREQIQNIE